MSAWTSGYVADIGYTYGYYQELNPLRVKLAFLNSGLVLPADGTACELGFGQGLSANIHAAASGSEWWGTDFNPSQASFAQELARASGAHLRDDSFEDFTNRSDLPDFDYIGLHGIWSWISDHNRRIIVDFIKRKLKVGGVLYISYNTLPGWAAFAPMRHLMTEHAEILGSEGRGIVSRIDGAIEFAEALLSTNPLFLRANPLVGERIGKIKDQNRHYLAHEYFNRDWHPMHFATMAEWLEPAKLHYACSAHYLDQIDAVNLSADQQKFLSEVPDFMYRQTVRDFMVNQQFRRDYWVRGARRLSGLEQAEMLRSHRVLLITPRSDVALTVAGALGEAKLSEPIYNPILDALSDHKPHSLGQIEQSLKGQVNLAQVIQAAIVLSGAGHIASVQSDHQIQAAKKASDKLNLVLMHKARSIGDISYLASPVTGGGITVPRFQQLFVSARQVGRKTPEELAKFTWDILASQGQRLLKEGKTLESEAENIGELVAMAKEFSEKKLAILNALGVS